MISEGSCDTEDLAPILIPPPHMYVHNHGNDDRGRTSEDTSIFKQKPTRISCVKQSKINVTHLSKRNNTTSASDSSPSRSLSFSPPLESCSDIYTGPTSCLIITLIFNVLFLWYFPLFFICHFSLSVVDLLISVLYTQIERSLLSISTRHAPLLLVGCVFWDSVRHCVKSVFQKSLRARLKERRSGPQLEETLIDPLFTDVAFRRDRGGDGSSHYESGGGHVPPVPSAICAPVRIHPLDQTVESSGLVEGLIHVRSLLALLNLSGFSFNFNLAPCFIWLQFQVIVKFRQYH